jgi:hypothetical protein
MKNRWPEAVEINLSILNEFPEDLETYNRLAKAMTELGRIREAKVVFQRVLEISPYNSIARKNLERLMKLDDADLDVGAEGGPAGNTFIEESGKAGVTALINTAPAKVLLREAPGHCVKLQIENGALKAAGRGGAYLGQVEPRLASRLTRLMKGENRYEAVVTSVDDEDLSIIIREVYQDPSQSGTVSFPLRFGAGSGASRAAPVGYDIGEEGYAEPSAVKDWSSDDTEPGDDDAFSPIVHRIISSGGDSEE